MVGRWQWGIWLGRSFQSCVICSGLRQNFWATGLKYLFLVVLIWARLEAVRLDAGTKATRQGDTLLLPVVDFVYIAVTFCVISALSGQVER
eukprot:s664_g12.t1